MNFNRNTRGQITMETGKSDMLWMSPANDLNSDPFYKTIWERVCFSDYNAVYLFNTIDSGKAATDEDLARLDLLNTNIEEVIPKETDSFEYVSIGQVIKLMNDSFGANGYHFVELSRRIDTINNVDYHFIIRMMLTIPSLGIFSIREGLESFSNKALKQGHRGISVSGLNISLLVDTSPEGLLSVWKNAEADAKKRCAVDLGIGSQFLVDPAENKKHSRKANAKAQSEDEGTEAPVQSEDDIVKRSESMMKLKIIMKQRNMKSPTLYAVAMNIFRKDITKWADLSTEDMDKLTEFLSGEQGGEAQQEVTV